MTAVFLFKNGDQGKRFKIQFEIKCFSKTFSYFAARNFFVD